MPLIKGLYYMKRRLDVLRRVLLLSYDIADKIDPPATSNAYTSILCSKAFLNRFSGTPTIC